MRPSPLLATLLLLFACRTDKLDSGQAPAVDQEDADADGYAEDDGDCDDDDASVHPGATEECDGLDNDCDGQIDEEVTHTYYADADGDGFGDELSTTEACDLPQGYVPNGTDCDDQDASAYPGGTEVCDNADNDCDEEIDEDVLETWYADQDQDGYGAADATAAGCAAPEGYVADSSDCDDAEPDAYPDNDEHCDGIDNDCDGDVDEDDAVDAATWYQDRDNDGYGDPDSWTTACAQPSSYVPEKLAQDCDDYNNTVSPAAEELCDGIDNDSDGVPGDDEGGWDEADAEDSETWYADSDGDGFGDEDDSVQACEEPSGYIDEPGDCDDGDAEINPDADELCDGADNDCDGDTDEDAEDAQTWYADDDGDSFGDAGDTQDLCEQPKGYVSDDNDCDDDDDDINPDASELCDGADNDCDGDTDEDDAEDTSSWYADGDGDGFGDADDAKTTCEAPSGYVSDDSDCDDTDPSVNPDASELCDGLDNDCDGDTDEDDAEGASEWYADLDGDGFGDADDALTTCDQPSGYVSDDTDCDDGDYDINPDAEEVCDGADNDCDGTADGDIHVMDFDAALTGSTMSLNGSTYQDWDGSDGYLELTGLSNSMAGTAFFLDLLPGDTWYASFSFETGSGSGADGLALAFLDETDPTLVGPSGGYLGLQGFSGYAVELDTYHNSGWDNNGNHLAVIDVASFSDLAFDTSIPTLEDSGWHDIEIWYDAGAIDVYLGGTQYISTTVSTYSPSEWLIGVAGATGGSTNYHKVDDLVIGCW